MNSKGYRYSLIWKVAYPIMFGNLAQTIITLTDTAFLGRISEVAMGASAMAGIYYYVFSTLAWGFAIGMQVIVARRFGEGRHDRIGVIFEHGMLFVGILSILLFSLLKFCSASVLNGLISSPNIYAAAMEYMNFRSWGIIFVCFNFLFRALYIGLSNTKVIVYTTVLMAIVNCIGDYALIFGNLGMPNLGIAGAAIASVAAEVCATIFFVSYTLLRLPLRKYRLFYFHKFEKWLLKDILKVALPTMFQKLISFGTWLVFFVMVERLGERALAISMTVRSVYMFLTIPIFALGATANSLTSRLIGEGRYKECVPMLYKIVKLCLAIVAPMMAVCFLFPTTLLNIYTDNQELIAEATKSLWVVTLAAVFMAFGQIFFEAISGTGNTAQALVLEWAALLVYTGFIWFTAGYMGGPIELVWVSEGVYGAMLGIVSWIYFRVHKWHRTII